MTAKSIAEQIEAIKSTGAKARVSKEAAIAFLERAGIIPLLTGAETNDKPVHSAPVASHAKNKAK